MIKSSYVCVKMDDENQIEILNENLKNAQNNGGKIKDIKFKSGIKAPDGFLYNSFLIIYDTP